MDTKLTSCELFVLLHDTLVRQILAFLINLCPIYLHSFCKVFFSASTLGITWRLQTDNL